jgi:large subunit ribosomal protein L32
MAVPKRKTSKSRRDRRRSHKAMMAPSFAECPKCKEMRLPHRVCPGCGHYRDRAVLELEEE